MAASVTYKISGYRKRSCISSKHFRQLKDMWYLINIYTYIYIYIYIYQLYKGDGDYCASCIL